MALKHVILTVLNDQESSGYDITRAFDEILGFFWQASHQQVYRELARLEREGWVRFRSVKQTGKPDKKVYRLTPEGKKALISWLHASYQPRTANDELLVRLLAADLLGLDGLHRVMAEQREIHQQRLQQYRAIEHSVLSEIQPAAMSLTQRMTYLTLRRGLGVEEAWLSWYQEVQDTLDELKQQGDKEQSR